MTEAAAKALEAVKGLLGKFRFPINRSEYGDACKGVLSCHVGEDEFRAVRAALPALTEALERGPETECPHGYYGWSACGICGDKVGKLRSQLAEVTAEMDRALIQVHNLTGENEGLADVQTAVEAMREAAEREREEARSRAKAAERERDTYQASNEEAQELLADHASEVERLRGRLSVVESALDLVPHVARRIHRHINYDEESKAMKLSGALAGRTGYDDSCDEISEVRLESAPAAPQASRSVESMLVEHGLPLPSEEEKKERLDRETGKRVVEEPQAGEEPVCHCGDTLANHTEATGHTFTEMQA